ncbi:MAG: chitobiase/beta-hexosaminidase C-terminal domain-containing protein [Muribaculaceae bacterium]
MKKLLLSALAVVAGFSAYATDYELVTGSDDIEVGKNYIIVGENSGSYYAMGEQKTSNRAGVAVTAPVNDVITINDEAVEIVTLEATESVEYPYYFKATTINAGYLYAASTGSNHLKTTTGTPEATATAKISVTSAGVAAIVFNQTSRNTMRFNYNNGSPLFSCYASGQSDIYLYKEVGDVTPVAVAKPVITPNGGKFLTTENAVVTIACETEGATIYYTTDGAEPDATSTVYPTDGFPLNADATVATVVKAIAVKEGETSAVATATFNFFKPYESLAAMLAAVPLPEDNKAYSEEFAVGFVPVVAYAYGSNVYITDSDGINYTLIYKQGTNLEAGQLIAPNWYAKAYNYNGTYELMPQSDITAKEEYVTVPDFAEVTDLSAVTAAQVNHLLILKGIEITEATPDATADNFTVTQGEAEYAFRNTFKLESVEPGLYDIVAAVSIYNGTLQFYPTEYDRLPAADAPGYIIIHQKEGTMVCDGDQYELTCETEGATIYYTEEEGGEWIEYTEPITMHKHVSIYAKAVAPGYNESEVEPLSWEVYVAQPEASVASGAVRPGTEVTLSCATEGVKIFYVLFNDESELTNASFVTYTEPFVINEATKLFVSAGFVNDDWDGETFDYTMWNNTELSANGTQYEYTIAEPIAVPDNLYIIGYIDGNNFTPAEAIACEKNDNVFTYTGIADDCGNGNSYFAFTEVQSAVWDDVNAARWSGAQGADQAINLDEATELQRGVDASMKLPAGTYKFEVTFTDYLVTLTVSEWSGVSNIAADAAADAEYYTLQGVRVAAPTAGGVYVVRRGNTVTKQYIR